LFRADDGAWLKIRISPTVDDLTSFVGNLEVDHASECSAASGLNGAAQNQSTLVRGYKIKVCLCAVFKIITQDSLSTTTIQGQLTIYSGIQDFIITTSA
jgi:hypothetical protein